MKKKILKGGKYLPKKFIIKRTTMSSRDGGISLTSENIAKINTATFLKSYYIKNPSLSKNFKTFAMFQQVMTQTPYIEELNRELREVGYISNPQVNMVIHLGELLKKPVLIEGEAGVGKTELAKAMSRVYHNRAQKQGRDGFPPDDFLVRLQIMEGLTKNDILYDYDYQKQFLYIEAKKHEKRGWLQLKSDLFSEEFLIERPILKFLRKNHDTVLLIDEIDKSDPELENMVLEFLGELQITIPEYKTIRLSPDNSPLIIVTSNATRNMSDPFLRRCLYLFMTYPNVEQQIEIMEITLKKEGVDFDKYLASQVAILVDAIREYRLDKIPSISELLDYYKTLLSLEITSLTPEVIESTLGILVKQKRDLDVINARRLYQEIEGSLKDLSPEEEVIKVIKEEIPAEKEKEVVEEVKIEEAHPPVEVEMEEEEDVDFLEKLKGDF